MADAAGENSQAEIPKTGIKLPAGALEQLTNSILEDVLYNIICSIALSAHRSEKLLRMSSAATQAESLALSTLDASALSKNTTTSSTTNTSSQQPAPTASTPAADYENGRVYLKGNPLQTTPEITCPHCKLPRLMHPIMGKGMQSPDLSKEYCMLYPWVQRSGHDCFGNPFPTDMAKSKKERELAKKNAESASVGTPGSQDTDMNGGEGSGVNRLNTGGKPANYIPWHTCPNCKRSLLITRFAQHLEKCLGISGRQSSRNAMAKLAGSNGNGMGSGVANTPLGSRMGTPAPGSSQGGLGSKDKKGSPVKRGEDDDDDDVGERKKKKKSSYIKKADRERMVKEGIPLKVKLKSGKSGDGGEKRDRDREGDGDEVPRKKIKLTLNKEESGSGNSESINVEAKDTD